MTSSAQPVAGPAGPVPTDPAAADAVPVTAAETAVTVATYTDYASAQKAVDYLSDNGFPVERLAIVGTDLRLVEHVMGRLTIARAALTGAVGGAWFGLLVGMVLAIFASATWWGVILFGFAVGALWGAVFGAIAHAMTGGRRDFISASSLEAGQYAILSHPEVASDARSRLTTLT